MRNIVFSIGATLMANTNKGFSQVSAVKPKAADKLATPVPVIADTRKVNAYQITREPSS